MEWHASMTIGVDHPVVRFRKYDVTLNESDILRLREEGLIPPSANTTLELIDHLAREADINLIVQALKANMLTREQAAELVNPLILNRPQKAEASE